LFESSYEKSTQTTQEKNKQKKNNREEKIRDISIESLETMSFEETMENLHLSANAGTGRSSSTRRRVAQSTIDMSPFRSIPSHPASLYLRRPI
jgi:hypothetical protein